MLRQYVESVRDFSSQYGSDGSISYTVFNLIGEHKREDHHDSSQSYLMKTYGPWWMLAPSSSKPFKEKSHHLYASQDFVELKYQYYVYPSAIEISEYNHCGAVCRIFACNRNTLRWHLLWQKKWDRQDSDTDSEMPFSPPLKKINILTNHIRLEFHHIHLDYFAEINSVCLIGCPEEKVDFDKSDLGIVRVFPNLTVSRNSSVKDLVGLNAISCQLDGTPITFGRLSVQRKLEKVTTNDKSSEKNYWEKLPKEIVNMLLKSLDLPTLCKASQSCRLLRDYCYDPILYIEVDLQPYWNMVSDRTLVGLISRCDNTHRLNLSWCGNNGLITARGIYEYFSACGENITGLYLSCCSFINADVLELLAEYCPNLQDLDLSNCHIGQPIGIRQISRFHQLKRLNLYSTLIDVQSLATILSGCQQLQFLNLGNCSGIINYDDVAYEISQRCSNLKGLELWRGRTLTALGLRFIATLKQLEELDIGWCSEIASSTGCLRHLVRSCPSLRKLFLSAIRSVCDGDIICFADSLANLEQLDILGTREVTPASCYRLLCNCVKLKLLDISFCGQIDFLTWSRWKEEFPWIAIKRYN